MSTTPDPTLLPEVAREVRQALYGDEADAPTMTELPEHLVYVSAVVNAMIEGMSGPEQERVIERIVAVARQHPDDAHVQLFASLCVGTVRTTVRLDRLLKRQPQNLDGEWISATGYEFLDQLVACDMTAAGLAESDDPSNIRRAMKHLRALEKGGFVESYRAAADDEEPERTLWRPTEKGLRPFGGERTGIAALQITGQIPAYQRVEAT